MRSAGWPDESYTCERKRAPAKARFKSLVGAGVLVPGHLGVISDAEEAAKIARGVGYPVMIKARRGRGQGHASGPHDDEVREGFRAASHEAKSSSPKSASSSRNSSRTRPIEIQAARMGMALLYLGERECSIQRRHQKVIEEAPSPFLDAKTRAAMGEQAVGWPRRWLSLRRHVEFIVDAKAQFLFLA